LFDPLVDRWRTLAEEVLGPLRWPGHPFLLARFGWHALQPCTMLIRSLFKGQRARALFAATCGHSNLALDMPLSSGFGLTLHAAGHALGWPIPSGGSQHITEALSSVLRSLGGRVITGARVESLAETRSADLTLCDVTPRQFAKLAQGAQSSLPDSYRRSLERYRHGPGVFKMDWALREPIPWRAKDCLRAATVHLGGSAEEIAASERAARQGQIPSKPLVILVQPSLFDPTRAPAGRHTAWAYCHVPNGSIDPAVEQIEGQIERFAPGFRECILARAAHAPGEMQAMNENLIGGDISGGDMTLTRFALRPTWRRYSTPLKGVYLCSSSTPPGGAVHGMCGYWAAKWALDWLKRKQ
jgi:phytoene dehydrogenase-like protein